MDDRKEDGSTSMVGRTKVESTDSGLELLTSKSLTASLSAPRAPPVESVHRAVLTGRPSGLTRGSNLLLPWVHSTASPSLSQRPPLRRDEARDVDNDARNFASDQDFHWSANERVLQARLRDRVLRGDTNRRILQTHPHLIDSTDDWTRRVLGGTLPVHWQHYLRDSGAFRFITDGLVTAVLAPSMAVTAPAAVRTFLSLSSSGTLRRKNYGSHPMQFVDVFMPSEQSRRDESIRRTIFFVHGGAWGSGRPWMYRLVAEPFRRQGWTVAVLGYRTYPDGSAKDQRNDCWSALRTLEAELPDWRQGKVTVMGHSSGTAIRLVFGTGAHIALLMLVDRVEQERVAGSAIKPSLTWVDSFVGLSGPYEISHHFDYEAARGVEELSPMKPACGHSREGFRHNSPALRLQAYLAGLGSPNEEPCAPILRFPSALLVHGIDDTTVPFTATADAARILRACGVASCQELYVADTGHQDTIVQLMFGGRTQSLVVDWITALDSSRSAKGHRSQIVVANCKL